MASFREKWKPFFSHEIIRCNELNTIIRLYAMNTRCLNLYCPFCIRSDLLAGLECIQSYTRRCMNQEQRKHFNELYHGTGEVIHELCDTDSKYQEGTYVLLFTKTPNPPETKAKPKRVANLCAERSTSWLMFEMTWPHWIDNHRYFCQHNHIHADYLYTHQMGFCCLIFWFESNFVIM